MQVTGLPWEALLLQQVHRITEWFGLEGTFKGHPVRPPCSEQGHLQPDQAAQSPVQPGRSREQASTASLGNLCQGFTTLIVKNVLYPV